MTVDEDDMRSMDRDFSRIRAKRGTYRVRGEGSQRELPDLSYADGEWLKGVELATSLPDGMVVVQCTCGDTLIEEDFLTHLAECHELYVGIACIDAGELDTGM